MTLSKGLNPSAIEPRNQVGNGITALATGLARSTLEACAIGDRQQLSRVWDFGGWMSSGSTQVFEVATLVRREWTQGILLVIGHGILRGGETADTCLQATPRHLDRQPSTQVTR
ncbi:MAG: hypothetical protein NVS2B16_20100 [Chloroflexota bacterium]